MKRVIFVFIFFLIIFLSANFLSASWISDFVNKITGGVISNVSCQNSDCKSISDGCCPNGCSAGSDADCCTQSGKYWLQNTKGGGCYISDYALGCSPNQLCGNLDGCCANWCSIGSDADCCTQSGKYWLQIGYGQQGCYNSNYNSGCSPNQNCISTADGCCPNWCSTGSDADCCTQSGKYWYNKPGYVGYGCWDSKNIPVGCSPSSKCNTITADGCCPDGCIAGTDVDCCNQSGKYWLKIDPSYGGYGCYSSDYNLGCSPGQKCINYTADGCCPNWCSASGDVDCCTQDGRYYLFTDTDYSCYSSDYNLGCSPGQKCLNTLDGCCPNWCSTGSDADCCTQSGKYWYNKSGQGYGCWNSNEINNTQSTPINEINNSPPISSITTNTNTGSSSGGGGGGGASASTTTKTIPTSEKTKSNLENTIASIGSQAVTSSVNSIGVSNTFSVNSQESTVSSSNGEIIATAASNIQVSTSEGKAYATKGDGVKQEIKVDPANALNSVKESIKTETIREIKVTEYKNKIVYEISAEKQVKILALIKSNMNIKFNIDVEEGKIISVEKPWWSFLAKGG